MSPRLFRISFHPYLRLLLACACALPLVSAACSNDDDSGDTAVADYAVTITSIDDDDSDEVALRCDGTLAVEVAISTSDASVPFILKPAYACGTSTRCGYVHLEALGADDAVLATVDSATLAGVLRLPADAEPVTIRATLLSGVDREPLKNRAGDVVTSSERPTFVAASGCEVEGMGGAGGSGAGGAGDGGTPGAGGDAPGGSDAGGATQGGGAQGGGDAGGAQGGGNASLGGAGGAP